ncbi:GNAT family N-acetyltransferase [Kiloniella laminariae]|uniref:GNAT family N-acetyltransferase n=1 Tax=Kiloniella laminariae TaxID=454162 RepID=UPI000371F893|nr:GNAT family N-acetyltransferase [Kiloniella laminariae]
MAIKIDLLRNQPRFIETCARWNHESWGQARGISAADILDAYRELADPENPEQAFVAFSGDTALGTTLLIDCDHPGFSHYRPWLAALYVRPEYRRQGIARALIDAVMDFSRRRGDQRLFLYSSSPEVYAAMGWQVASRFMEERTHYFLMNIELQTNSDQPNS